MSRLVIAGTLDWGELLEGHRCPERLYAANLTQNCRALMADLTTQQQEVLKYVLV